MAKVKVRGGKRHGQVFDVPDALPAWWRIVVLDGLPSPMDPRRPFQPFQTFHCDEYRLESYRVRRESGRVIKVLRYVPRDEPPFVTRRQLRDRLYPKTFA